MSYLLARSGGLFRGSSDCLTHGNHVTVRYDTRGDFKRLAEYLGNVFAEVIDDDLRCSFELMRELALVPQFELDWREFLLQLLEPVDGRSGSDFAADTEYETRHVKGPRRLPERLDSGPYLRRPKLSDAFTLKRNTGVVCGHRDDVESKLSLSRVTIKLSVPHSLDIPENPPL